jgi:hypothetical protein
VQTKICIEAEDFKPKKNRTGTFFYTQTTGEKLGDCCIISLGIFITRYPTEFASTVWTMPITWGKHLQREDKYEYFECQGQNKWRKAKLLSNIIKQKC